MSAAELPDVDVVIVARDAGALLERAVASVEGQVAPGRVAIVDAGSTDGSVEAVRATHPDARTIRVESRGFAAAVNAGLAATSGEFVLVLHASAELEDRCLSPLVTRLRSNRTAAIAAPRVVDVAGQIEEGSFGQFPTLGRATVALLNRLAHRMSKGIAKQAVDFTSTTPVDWVTGACVLVRRAAVEKAGVMDEGFGAWFADVEWCHRLHESGYTVLIEPMATCVWRGETASQAETDRPATSDLVRYCRLTHTTGLLTAARLGGRPDQLPLG